MTIVENIVRSSSQPVRYKLYNILKKEAESWFTIPELHLKAKIGRKAIGKQCDILWNLGKIEKKVIEERIGGYVFTNHDGYEEVRGGRFEKVAYYKFKEVSHEQSCL